MVQLRQAADSFDLVGHAIREECRQKLSEQSFRASNAFVRTRTFAILQWGRSHRRPILLSLRPNRPSRVQAPIVLAAEVPAVAAREASAGMRESRLSMRTVGNSLFRKSSAWQDAAEAQKRNLIVIGAP